MLYDFLQAADAAEMHAKLSRMDQQRATIHEKVLIPSNMHIELEDETVEDNDITDDEKQPVDPVVVPDIEDMDNISMPPSEIEPEYEEIPPQQMNEEGEHNVTPTMLCLPPHDPPFDPEKALHPPLPPPSSNTCTLSFIDEHQHRPMTDVPKSSPPTVQHEKNPCASEPIPSYAPSSSNNTVFPPPPAPPASTPAPTPAEEGASRGGGFDEERENLLRQLDLLRLKFKQSVIPSRPMPSTFTPPPHTQPFFPSLSWALVFHHPT